MASQVTVISKNSPPASPSRDVPKIKEKLLKNFKIFLKNRKKIKKYLFLYIKINMIFIYKFNQFHIINKNLLRL